MLILKILSIATLLLSIVSSGSAATVKAPAGAPEVHTATPQIPSAPDSVTKTRLLAGYGELPLRF